MKLTLGTRHSSLTPSPRRDRGGSVVEYAGTILVVAAVAAAVLTVGVPDRVNAMIDTSLCKIGAGDDCDEPSTETASGEESRTSSPEPLSPPKPPDPDEGEVECNTSWPNLESTDPETAKRLIEAQDPDVNVSIVPEGSLVTKDFRCNRVRLHVDSDSGKIIDTPRVG